MKAMKFLPKGIFILLIQYSSCVVGQNNTFIRTFANGNTQATTSAIEIADEGYILTTTETLPGNNLLPNLIKINLEGDTIMSHAIPDNYGNGWLAVLMKLSDGVNIGIGPYSSVGNTQNKLWVILFDNELNILKTKKYDVPYKIFKLGSCLDHYGNIIVNGFYNYTNSIDGEDIFIFRLSAEGDSLNYARFQYPSVQWSTAITEKPDYSGYYMPIWGRMTSLNLYLANMVELDYNFNITFEDSITNDLEHNNNIRKFNGAQYLLTGQIYLPFMPYTNEFIAIEKLDKNYHASSYQHIGPSQVDTISYAAWYRNLDFIDTNNIFVGGTVNFNLYPITDRKSYFILTNLDSELNKRWQYFYGFDKYYELYGILATADGGCLLYGTCCNYTNPEINITDVILIKVDSSGLVTGIPHNPDFRISSAILYPNPGSEWLNIQSGPQVNGAGFTLYNLHGRPLLNQTINNTQLKLNTAALPSGIYPWQIVFKNKLIESGKWIKE